MSRGITVLVCFRDGGKHFADSIKGLNVGDGIGARRASDGRLVHQHHVSDILSAGDFLESVHRRAGAAGDAFFRCQRLVQNVVNQRGFA